MKKFISYFSVLFVLFSLSTGYATENYSSTFKTPKIVSTLNFTAILQDDGSVKTSWNSYNDDLKYYKISRSQINDNPFYPDDGYIFYSSTETKYIDENPPSGKNYYRVCAISNANDRICSPVITLNITDSSKKCVQVITYAQKDDKCQSFSSSCHVPDGWEIVDECALVEVISTNDLKLTVQLKDDKPYLEWNFKDEGTATNGYKLIISTKNPKPTYPVLNGDYYRYLPNNKTKSYHDKDAEAGKAYYYRVCVYANSKCINYSNATSITLPKLINKAETEKVDDTSESRTNFSDVKKGVWFESSLANLVERGVITGYNDGSFQPSKTINRAEMAKMVVKALDIKTKSSDMEIFCDVSQSDWFQPYVLQLYFDNIIEGYTGGNCTSNRLFRPAQEVTRAEGIKIILLMFNAEIEPLKIGDQTGFTDIDISHWSAPYIRKAFSLGIIRGYDDGSFQPNTPLTRAEFVKMLSEAEMALK